MFIAVHSVVVVAVVVEPFQSKPKPESKCSMWKVLRESKQWYIMQLPVWLQNKVHWQTAYIVGHKVTFGLLLILSNVTVWLASGKHLDRNEDTKDSLHSCPQCAWDGESERCWTPHQQRPTGDSPSSPSFRCSLEGGFCYELICVLIYPFLHDCAMRWSRWLRN